MLKTTDTPGGKFFVCSWCGFEFGKTDPTQGIEVSPGDFDPGIKFCPYCGVNLTTFQPPVETGIYDQHGRYIMVGDRVHVVVKQVHERDSSMDRTDDFIGTVVWKDGAFYLQATPYVRTLLSRYMGTHWTQKKFEVVDKTTKISTANFKK